MGNRFQRGLTITMGAISVADAVQFWRLLSPQTCLWMGHLPLIRLWQAAALLFFVGAWLSATPYRTIWSYLLGGALLCASVHVLYLPRLGQEGSLAILPPIPWTQIAKKPAQMLDGASQPGAFVDLFRDLTQTWKDLRPGERRIPVTLTRRR